MCYKDLVVSPSYLNLLYLKPRSDESKIADAKQRVIVLLLLEKGTKEYCDNLDVQVTKENKEF